MNGDAGQDPPNSGGGVDGPQAPPPAATAATAPTEPPLAPPPVDTQPASPAKPRWHTWQLLIASAVTLILGLGIGAAVSSGGDGDDDDDSASATTPTTRTGNDEDEEPDSPARSSTTSTTTRSSGGEGTREDPFALGTPLTTDDGWEIIVNTVNFDPAGDIAATNQFNDPAPAGLRFILVNSTVTNGSDEPGYPDVAVSIELIGSANRVYGGANSYCSAVIPGPLSDAGELFPGGSFTGNTCLQVPEDEAADGSLLVAVSPSFGDPVFVRTT